MTGITDVSNTGTWPEIRDIFNVLLICYQELEMYWIELIIPLTGITKCDNGINIEIQDILIKFNIYLNEYSRYIEFNMYMLYH